MNNPKTDSKNDMRDQRRTGKALVELPANLAYRTAEPRLPAEQVSVDAARITGAVARGKILCDFPIRNNEHHRLTMP